VQYFIVIFLLGGLLSGCASKPVFDTSDVDETLNPAAVINEQERSLNKRVLWGGTILDMQNMKDSTRIEVLSYPLGSNHRPNLEKKPLGRFLIRQEGFLEPETYVQGRQITVVGKVGKAVNGQVGESDYSFPLIHAQQLQLWSKEDKVRTNFQFGIGIRL
jgi:outer membrane lipoprotein